MLNHLFFLWIGLSGDQVIKRYLKLRRQVAGVVIFFGNSKGLNKYNF